jgi:hypothetical protein
MPTKAQQENKARLKRMHSKAKAYMRKHPSAKYSTALKEAGRLERGKRVGVVKKKKSGGRKPAKKKARGRVGSTVSASTKKKLRTAHEREGNLLSQLGTLTVSQVGSRLRKMKEDQLAWLLLSIDKATTKTGKRKLLKQKARLKAQIKALS